jgi:hypothetical protein
MKNERLLIAVDLSETAAAAARYAVDAKNAVVRKENCARAQSQLQGVDQDGFAGTGFTGQHREPAGQVQLEFVDDDEIAKRDAFEAHR